VRRSNASGLRALLALRGYPATGEDHLPDDPEVLRERLAAHLAAHDVLVLSGGSRWDASTTCRRCCARWACTRCCTASRSGRASRCGSGAGRRAVGVRAAGQPGLGAGLRRALPAAGAGRGRAGRSAAAGTRPARSGLPRDAAAVVFPAREARTSSRPRHPSRCPGPRTARGLRIARGHDGFVELPPGPAEYPAGHVRPCTLVKRMTGTSKDTRSVTAHPASVRPRDRFGRPMHDLRISVMDRCNFRCPYCMPKETFHDRYRFLRRASGSASRRSPA